MPSSKIPMKRGMKMNNGVIRPNRTYKTDRKLGMTEHQNSPKSLTGNAAVTENYDKASKIKISKAKGSKFSTVSGPFDKERGIGRYNGADGETMKNSAVSSYVKNYFKKNSK